MSNHKLMKAHVIAHAMANGEKWYFAPDNWFWRLEAKTVGRVWNKIVRMKRPAERSRNRCFRLPGVTIVHGFTELRNFEALKEHGDEIRKIFSAQKNKCVESIKLADKKKLVGVHVRRTDYRIWNNGKYYYGNDVYERVINEMRQQLGEARFIVFTDEPDTLNHNLAALNAQLSSAELDQSLMSECDYLIGPPSTFTLWASFMGKVPLLHVLDAKQKIQLCDFVMKW